MIGACGTVVLVCIIVAGLILASGTGPSPVVIQSPTRANSAVFAAAVAAGSVHYSSVSTDLVAGKLISGTQYGDAGQGMGIQYQNGPEGDIEVIVVGSRVFMEANVTGLENTFGYSDAEATPFANEWISFARTDSMYLAIASDVTDGSIWANQSLSPSDGLPQTPQSVSSLSTLNGMPVQSVRYSLHGTSQAEHLSYNGTESILFSATQHHLPNSLTERLAAATPQGNVTATDRTTFSHWGETVNVHAPASSTPFSSLPTPSSTV